MKSFFIGVDFTSNGSLAFFFEEIFEILGD